MKLSLDMVSRHVFLYLCLPDYVIRAAHTAHQYGHYQVILINMLSQDLNPQHTSSHLESERVALTNALVDESNFDTVKVIFSYLKES